MDLRAHTRAEMAQLREAAGLSRLELARLVNVSRSYVGQVETGTTRCRCDFVGRIDKALGSDTTLTDLWDDALRSARYPRYFVDFAEAERDATVLRGYENRLVYGLFQTSAYSRVLLASEEEVDARMQRQLIFEQKNPPLVSVVLDETVLLRQVGSAAVMRETCDRLLALAERPNVFLQIAPIAYYRDARGPFAVASLPDDHEVAWLENAARFESSTDAAELSALNRTFTRLSAEALNVRDSRAFIERVLRERWSGDEVAEGKPER
jgi:transcriptional regulator with XRE-family HTH domain